MKFIIEQVDHIALYNVLPSTTPSISYRQTFVSHWSLSRWRTTWFSVSLLFILKLNEKPYHRKEQRTHENYAAWRAKIFLNNTLSISDTRKFVFIPFLYKKGNILLTHLFTIFKLLRWDIKREQSTNSGFWSWALIVFTLTSTILVPHVFLGILHSGFSLYVQSIRLHSRFLPSMIRFGSVLCSQRFFPCL